MTEVLSQTPAVFQVWVSVHSFENWIRNNFDLSFNLKSFPPFCCYRKYQNSTSKIYSLVHFHLSLNPGTQICKEKPSRFQNFTWATSHALYLSIIFWPLLFCTWQKNKINTFFRKVISTSCFVEDIIAVHEIVFCWKCWLELSFQWV